MGSAGMQDGPQRVALTELEERIDERHKDDAAAKPGRHAERGDYKGYAKHQPRPPGEGEWLIGAIWLGHGGL